MGDQPEISFPFHRNSEVNQIRVFYALCHSFSYQQNSEVSQIRAFYALCHRFRYLVQNSINRDIMYEFVDQRQEVVNKTNI